MVGLGAVLFSNRDSEDFWIPVRDCNSLSETPAVSLAMRKRATKSEITFGYAFSSMAIAREAATFSFLVAASSATARRYFSIASADIAGKFFLDSGFNIVAPQSISRAVIGSICVWFLSTHSKTQNSTRPSSVMPIRAGRPVERLKVTWPNGSCTMCLKSSGDTSFPSRRSTISSVQWKK